jgi:hypothetical protein
VHPVPTQRLAYIHGTCYASKPYKSVPTKVYTSTISPKEIHFFHLPLTNHRVDKVRTIWAPTRMQAEKKFVILPVAASDCAISFEWWGNTRSTPPACRSIVSPRCARHIAEHSMCQPVATTLVEGKALVK